MAVLRSAKEALKKTKAVLAEYNEQTYKAAGTSAEKLRDFLCQFGFEWFRLPFRPSSPEPVDWTKLGRACDLIAVRKKRT